MVTPGFNLAAGRIAQLVEQLTLNQRVQGSNPCAPTNEIKDSDRSRQYPDTNTPSCHLGVEVHVACVALISSRLGGGALVRARLADATNFAVIIAGSGLLNAKAQDGSQGNALLVFPVPVT